MSPTTGVDRRQGLSGLGLEAQAEAVEDAARTAATGRSSPASPRSRAGRRTGKVKHRPQLQAALACCRVMGARLVSPTSHRLTATRIHRTSWRPVSRSNSATCRTSRPGRPVRAAQLAAVAELEAGMSASGPRRRSRAAKARGLTEEAGRAARGNRVAGRRPRVARPARASPRRDRGSAARCDLAPVIAEVRASGVESLGGMRAARGAPHPHGPRQGPLVAEQVSRVLQQMETPR